MANLLDSPSASNARASVPECRKPPAQLVAEMRRCIRAVAGSVFPTWDNVYLQIRSEQDRLPVKSFNVYPEGQEELEATIEARLERSLEESAASTHRRERRHALAVRMCPDDHKAFDDDPATRELCDILLDVRDLEAKIEKFIRLHGRGCECRGCQEVERLEEDFGGTMTWDALTAIMVACQVRDSITEQHPVTVDYWIEERCPDLDDEEEAETEPTAIVGETAGVA